jgi:hypothetical protein
MDHLLCYVVFGYLKSADIGSLTVQARQASGATAYLPMVRGANGSSVVIRCVPM